MKEIDELYLINQRKNSDSYNLVFYNTSECIYCKQAKLIVESIEKNFPEIEFVSLDMKDLSNTSAFAPAAVS